jgi:hypothetical protein
MDASIAPVPVVAAPHPVSEERVAAVVVLLVLGAVGGIVVGWPLAVLMAVAAIAVDVPRDTPFSHHRAAAFVAIDGRPRRPGWQRYAPLERAGPDVVLNESLNGALVAAIVASLVLVFVSPAAMIAVLAVLLAAYACVGRPERAWVSRGAVAGYRQLWAPQGQGAPALPPPPQLAVAPWLMRSPRVRVPVMVQPATPVARPAPVAAAAPAVAAPVAVPSAEPPVPMTGPEILARLDAVIRRAVPGVPANAVASLSRIRVAAVATLPADSRALNFSDRETWLVRQTACDYLPTAIDRYLAVNPAQRGRPMADGRSAGEVLVDSLRRIERFLAEAAVQAYERDATAMLAYERFLDARLARPDELRIDR